MDIRISKIEVFGEVEKRTSLEGFVDSAQFDRIWAHERRRELLDSYWIEGYTAVIQLLKRYLSSESVLYSLDAFNEDEVLTLSISTPQRYDDNLDGSVLTDIKMMLACNILAGWLKVVAPELSSKYDTESKGYAEDLRVKFLYRKEPSDSLSAPKTDSESIIEEEAGLSAPKTDNIIMTQGWGRCPICNEVHESFLN